jgi:type 1 glutamine amidotransferase
MKKFQSIAVAVLIVALASAVSVAQKAPKVSWKNVKILVYTKNGKGYVHKNIPDAVKAIQKLGTENGFRVDVSEDPSVFTDDNLKQYTFLLFPSTNNDVFDTDAQRVAFRRYIEAGGGFVGLHSVVGTERNWTWFKMMLGGTFAVHPHFQPLHIRVIDDSHPSVSGVPAVWVKEDECYFLKEWYPGIRTVMAHDLSALTLTEKEQQRIAPLDSAFGRYYPAAWYQDFDGGTIWITTLGHDGKDYSDPQYVHHVLEGMTFVASQVRRPDFSKAYARERDAPLP